MKCWEFNEVKALTENSLDLHDMVWANEQNRLVPLQDECRNRGIDYPKKSTMAELRKLIQNDIDRREEMARLIAAQTHKVDQSPAQPGEAETAAQPQETPPIKESIVTHSPDSIKPDAGKQLDVEDVLNDYRREEISADFARKRIDRELTSWIEANPNGDHQVARRTASNAKA